jgi:hypothetical protein
MIKKNPHWGTTVDEFLSEEGVREAAKGEAAARAVAWQLRQKAEQQDGGERVTAFASSRSNTEQRQTSGK